MIHTNCRICGKELTDPVSIESGIGPVCRMQLKIENMNLTMLFVNRAQYTWEKHGYIISIIDMNSGKAVTNDINNILKEINHSLGVGESIDIYRVIYRDTMGIWDRVKHKGTICTGFYSINETNYEKAIQKVK